MGRLQASPLPMARAWAAGLLNEPNLAIADEVARTATDLGTTPTAVALAWVRQHPDVTSVIVGPRTVEQLEGNLHGLDFELPPEARARLDEASRPAVRTPVNGMTNQP
jgi:aryl-alcohol dehydrogenase-like predicted oxidoreductase